MNERELTILLIGVVMSLGFFIMAYAQYKVYKIRRDAFAEEEGRMRE